MWFHRSKVGIRIIVLWLAACERDEVSSQSAETRAGAGEPATAAGRTARRPPTACDPHEPMQVTCGGEVCPSSTEHERDPCFLPCCVQHEGKERCGFRGTSRAFTTECALPAVSDPSCDEVPQFEGCCEPTRQVCGVISGFAPGCQTESRFLTFPDPLKRCGAALDGDGGID